MMRLNYKENIQPENQEPQQAAKELFPLLSEENWDLHLWKEFKDDNEKAFQLLYKKYYPLLFNYGIRISKNEDIIRDCIHDLFVDIWKYRYKLTDPQSVKKYMLLSVRRKIIKAMVRDGKFVVTSFKADHYGFDFVLSQEEVIINDQSLEDRKRRLLKAMNELTPKQKEAIYLKYYENLSSEEIASVMSLTLNSTYVIISESMKVLKRCIKKYLPIVGTLLVATWSAIG